MSYKITTHVFQTNPSTFFRVVEKTVWHFANGGTWDSVDGTHVLTMGGSGTSGSLRFLADDGEHFIVTLGVHNYKRWGDIVANVPAQETASVVNAEYYNSKHHERTSVREKQLASQSVWTGSQRKISFNYTEAEGHDLKVDIIIG